VIFTVDLTSGELLKYSIVETCFEQATFESKTPLGERIYRQEVRLMQIITIYQGASGSGEELAEAVAQSLGYGSIDREVLVEASLRYGIPQAKLTEILEREPTWWATFTRNLEPYRIALQAAFCEVAKTQGMVYRGHIGHELIPKFPHVLKVLLTAPMEVRVEQIQARHGLNEVAARRYIEEVDKARTRRLKGMFSTDWRDASRYDLVVNLGYMRLETAKRLVIETARAPEYQMTPASKQAFEDFALASRVKATLLLGNDLSNSRFDVKVREGNVEVSGTIPDWVSDDHIAKQVRGIPGVKSVTTDLTNLSPSLGLNE
jgi:cytidylate kinase